MGVYTTIPSYIRRQESRLVAVARNTATAHRLLAEEGRKDFLRMTGGTLKAKTLRAMGHPYARAGSPVGASGRGANSKKDWRRTGLKGQVNKRGRVKPLPVNIQSGALRRSITLDGPSGSSKIYRLQAKSEHARFALAVKGTTKTVPRGLLGANGYLRRMHKLRKHVMRTALKAAHRQ